MGQQQQPRVGDDVTALMGGVSMSSREKPKPEPKRPEQILAESDPNYMGAEAEQLGVRAAERAPAIGAGAAAAMAGPGVIIPGLAAAGGGFVGGLMRGDSMGDAAVEGTKQGLFQVVGGGLVKGGRAIAHGLMRGTVPKNIAKEFAGVDISQEMLDRGVVPGSARSARRVEGLSNAANAEREAAAVAVPNMSRRKVVDGLRPIYNHARTAKMPDMADNALKHMRKSAKDIGPSGLDGPAALARKDIQQDLSSAAISNPDIAAFAPKLHDAERAAIVEHLRETPRMATALNESQKMMALKQVMEDAAHSNPVTRARIGGLTAAAMSPIGLGATAHVVNQGSRAVSPNALRLLDLLMGQRAGQ